jgi:hypothetical protein
MNTKKFIFCNNCGKLGHLFHQCKVPITSIGIIPIRITKKVNPLTNPIENDGIFQLLRFVNVRAD